MNSFLQFFIKKNFKNILLFVYIAHFCSSENSLDENQNIVLKDPHGVIQTPGYPLSSAGVLIKQCYWKILAPKGKAIRVYFSSFRLYTTDCVGVVYKLNDRLSSSVKPVGCGWSPPFAVYSMTNELGIKVNKPSTSTIGLTFIANYRIIPAGKKKCLKRLLLPLLTLFPLFLPLFPFFLSLSISLTLSSTSHFSLPLHLPLLLLALSFFISLPLPPFPSLSPSP